MYSRFHQICVSDPYNLHTRTRQEMGQDIAGACGQLALVNPGKMGDAEGRDIEDAAGSSSSKKGAKTKPAARSAAKKGADVEGSSGGGVVGGWGVKSVKDVHLSTALCYVNIAVPLVLSAVAFFVPK